MGDKEWSPSNILDVFGDPIARATLVLANGEPVSVKAVADDLDVSPPTIYRRIDPLVDANLLQESRRIDQNGNQRKVYETLLDEVTFTIEDDSYSVDIKVNQDLAGDFESIWSDLETTGGRTPHASQSEPTRSNATRGDPVE